MTHTQVFGIHAVAALLESSPAKVLKVLFNADRNDARLRDLKTSAEAIGVQCDMLGGKEFRRQFDRWNHQGVVAYRTPLEPMSEPEMLEKLSALDTPALVLVLDQITDPHNFGAILRTADATGVHCVITPKSASVGITPVVRKVASGAAESVPVCRVANLSRCLGELKSIGVWLYGAAGEQHAVDYHRVDFRSSAGIVMGAEGRGLRRLSCDACDEIIRIPMVGSVSSLNVSVATGICLYEVLRQRSV